MVVEASKTLIVSFELLAFYRIDFPKGFVFLINLMFVGKKFVYLSIQFNQIKNLFWHRLNQCGNILIFVLSNLLLNPFVLQELMCNELELLSVVVAVKTTVEVASILACK